VEIGALELLPCLLPPSRLLRAGNIPHDNSNACAGEQVAEQAQEEESRLSAELERTARQLEHSELRIEEAEQQALEQKNSARQATAERDKMDRELTGVLEAIARGNVDEIRRRHGAGEFCAPGQPNWLGSQRDSHQATAESSAVNGGSFAWMDDPLGADTDQAREERQPWRSSSDRSRSPSLLSDDGEVAGSIASTSTAESREIHDSLHIDQALERSRQRAADLRRQQQQQRDEDNSDAATEESINKDEVAFMAMAAAREVHAKQERANAHRRSPMPAAKGSVDARQVRTPVTSAVRSHDAANASAARRRNKRVKQRQKMARLSAAEAGV
jgi:hypothetical protein